MSEEVFSIAEKHPPRDFLTISTNSGIQSENNITYFSLGKNTDISEETYPNNVVLIGNHGLGEITLEGRSLSLGENEFVFIPGNSLYGVSTKVGFVYTEILLKKVEYNMNELINAGEVFKLADLLPYEEGSVVNMDIISNDGFKFVIMAFDEGTGLSEHAAPGEAIIFALDGKGVIGYEGEDHPIQAGENFHFAKGGMHSVKTVDSKFKMALILAKK